MTTDENKRIVEVNGIKMEIDLRTAKRIDTFRIGDRVKVLVKNYSGYAPYYGVIVAFDDFKNRPNITVCYVQTSYGSGTVEFAHINSDSDDIEIVATDEGGPVVEKADVIGTLNREIEKKRAEINDIEAKKRYFLEQFGKYFEGDDKEHED